MPTTNVHLERAEHLIAEAGKLLHERRPLMESAALLSESAPFPVWAVDRLGRTLWANHEFEAAVRATIGELRGRKLATALGPMTEGLVKHDDAVVMTGRSRRYEVTMLGEGKARQVLKWPLYGEDGAIIGVCGAMT